MADALKDLLPFFDDLPSNVRHIVEAGPAPRDHVTRTSVSGRISQTLGSLVSKAHVDVDPAILPPLVPPAAILLSAAVLEAYGQTDEGQLIRALEIPLLEILGLVRKDRNAVFGIDPRKWEEIVAASYEKSGLFDEVTLTPRSGDHGRDLIAVKKGHWSVRVIESIKRYTPGHYVTADEVRALLGAALADPQVTKGLVSTTWEFAPRVLDDPGIARHHPIRLELVNGDALIKRMVAHTTKK